MSTDAAIRRRLHDLAGALRAYHSALLHWAKEDYEFLHGPVDGPYQLYALAMNDPAFQWLRPLSGLMATLDEVLDRKDTALNEKHVQDVQSALELLFNPAESRFAEFRSGYNRAQANPLIRQAESVWRKLLGGLEA